MGCYNPLARTCAGGSIRPMVQHAQARRKCGYSAFGFFLPCLQASAESHSMRPYLLPSLFVLIGLNGCAVIAVADAAVVVAATTVKVGARVVGTTVDVASAGVKAVAGSSDEK